MEDLFDEIGMEHDDDKQIKFIEFLKGGKVVARFEVSQDIYDTTNNYTLFKGVRRIKVNPIRSGFLGLRKKIPSMSEFMPSLLQILQPRLKLTTDGKLVIAS